MTTDANRVCCGARICVLVLNTTYSNHSSKSTHLLSAPPSINSATPISTSISPNLILTTTSITAPSIASLEICNFPDSSIIHLNYSKLTTTMACQLICKLQV